MARYKVTNIVQRPVMNPNGTFTDVYEVHFETTFGIKSTVQIPAESFNPKLVKAEIDKKVDTLEEIMKLTG